MPCDCGDWAARARAQLHWYSTEHAAWLRHSEGDDWTGWEALGAHAVIITAPGWQPWTAVSDASEEPYVRWFCGALTNAAFNEIDRHVLQVSALAATARQLGPLTASSASACSPPCSHASPRSQGHGAEVAFHAETPHAPPESMTLRQLLLQSALAASAMADELELSSTARLAVYMPNHPAAVVWMAAAKRLGLAYVAVAAGTVAAVLAERLDDTRAEIVLTTPQLQPVARQAIELSELDATPRLVLAHAAAAAEATESQATGPALLATELLERAHVRLLSRPAPAQQPLPPPPHAVSSSSTTPDSSFVAALWRLSPARAVESSHPLFILYTSGSTGRPKGIVHVHGGYEVRATHARTPSHACAGS